jgi:membrane-bound lytic murein transglycosylase F
VTEYVKAVALSIAVVAVVLSLGFLGAHLSASLTGLEGARSSGTLTMLTPKSATSYWTYEDEQIGFEYELARRYAESLQVSLRVVTVPRDELYERLKRTRTAFVATGVTAGEPPPEHVRNTRPYMRVGHALVVHASEYFLDTGEELSGRAVHVRAGSPDERSLRDRVADGLNVDVVPREDLTAEELLQAVHEEEIGAAAVDAHLLRHNRRYIPALHKALELSDHGELVWAVKNGNRSLMESMNRFIRSAERSGMIDRLQERFYGHSELFDYVELRTFHRAVDSRLPQYREAFQEAAAEHGFDWRLIAAMAYQESHWNPRARSFAGARGIMQLTHRTAREIGVSNRMDPEESIRGGVSYLATMYGRFEGIEQEDDRLAFALASYNVGYSHVRDAQKIAEQLDLDPTRWRSMEEALPLKSRPEYYEEADFGFARGDEPVEYVRRIRVLYDILRYKAATGNGILSANP